MVAQLRALWQYEKKSAQSLQASLDEREMDMGACVEELRRLESYHHFMNHGLLGGGGHALDDQAAIVVDDPFLLCQAAEALVKEAAPARGAHLYLLSTDQPQGNGDSTCTWFLQTWVSHDEEGRRRTVRLPVNTDDEAGSALAFALQEEDPLLLDGASLVMRVVDREGQVLGLVELVERQHLPGLIEPTFTAQDVAALEALQDHLASVLLLLRLVRRRQDASMLLAQGHTHTHSPTRPTRRGSPLSSLRSSPTASSLRRSPPVSPLRVAILQGRQARAEEQERAATLRQQEEVETVREKYNKAKTYIRRLEKELNAKVQEQERALLARQATEGAKRLFEKVGEMEALVAELSARQEQLRDQNEALRTEKVQVEAHARTKIRELKREKEALATKNRRLKEEGRLLAGAKECLKHDLRRSEKKLAQAQRAMEQAHAYQDVLQGELLDMKASLVSMEAGTNELRQQLLQGGLG